MEDNLGPEAQRQEDLGNLLFQLCCHFGNWNVKICDTGFSTVTLGGRGCGGWILEFSSEEGLCQGCVNFHQPGESGGLSSCRGLGK